MISEFNQIINLVKSKNEKIEDISYKEVYKLKLNPENNNNTSIVFNTQNNSINIPSEFAEFNLTLKLVDLIYVTDQDVTQTLVSSHLYVDRVILHEIEKLEYLKNHNNFNVNITFLENYVKKDNNNITNENFDVFVNNVRNCNDLFLLLIKDNNNTLKLPNKKCKNIQLYTDNQKFQTEILSDLDAYIELKNRSEYINEFILDYNRFLNNYTIYSFPIYRDSRFDKNNKYINISRQGIDDNDSRAIIIWRKKSYINLKINNNFLEVIKTY